MVQEESGIDLTTGEEARGETSSYEDALEGLCSKTHGKSRALLLQNCIMNLKVGGKPIKSKLVDKRLKRAEQLWRIYVGYFLCSLGRTK